MGAVEDESDHCEGESGADGCESGPVPEQRSTDRGQADDEEWFVGHKQEWL
jgi:hypothetical protein